jgi:hypothetical protein
MLRKYTLLFLVFLRAASQLWITEYQTGDTSCNGPVMRTSNPTAACMNMSVTPTSTLKYHMAGCNNIYNLPLIMGCIKKCNDTSSCSGTLVQNYGDTCLIMTTTPSLGIRQLIGSCTPTNVPQPTGVVTYQEFLDSSCTIPIWYPHNHVLTSCFTRFQSTSESFACSGDFVNKTTYINTKTCASGSQTSFIQHRIGQCEKRDLSTLESIYVIYSSCNIKQAPPGGTTSPRPRNGQIVSILSWIIVLISILID